MFIIVLLLFSAIQFASNQPVLNDIFPHLPQLLTTNNTKCIEQYEEFLRNLVNQTLWAYQIQDSSATSATGVLSGSTYHLGNFDQCLQIRAPFTTKYCLAEIRADIQPQSSRDKFSLYHDPYENVFDRIYPWDPKNQLPINVVKLGWCIPASCTLEDLEGSLNAYLNETQSSHVRYHGKIDEKFCYNQEESIKFDRVDIIFVLVSVSLILLAVIGTYYQSKIEAKKTKTKLQRIIASFSLTTNFEALSRADSSDPSTLIFYGIRFITLQMVIFMHVFSQFIPLPVLNLENIHKQFRMVSMQLFFRGDLMMDLVFAIGGIMVAYHLFSFFERKSINPACIIVKRYFRLTPVYAFVILCMISILDNLGNGPFWKSVVIKEAQDCRDNWWTSLLYLNNYINADHICMFHTWYLPCDFHFFITSTMICFIINKRKRLGFTILGLSIVISILIPTITTWINSSPALLLGVPPLLVDPKTDDYILSYYIKSHQRAAPYFLGLIMGYVYYKNKGVKKRLDMVQSWTILVVSVLLISACFSSGIIFYNPDHKYNRYEAAIYAGLIRSVFTVGALGVVYTASYGFRFLHAFLSWKIFIPFSKLVYSAYIVHELSIYVSVGSLRAPQYFSFVNVISAPIPHIVGAYITALVLNLLIEAPFRRISNILLT